MQKDGKINIMDIQVVHSYCAPCIDKDVDNKIEMKGEVKKTTFMKKYGVNKLEFAPCVSTNLMLVI